MSYSHLTQRERYVITHLRFAGLSYREIGRRLMRSHTTILREVKRNQSIQGTYHYDFSHLNAIARRRIARHSKRQENKSLIRYVTHRLTKNWSPEQISNRLKLDHSNNSSMRISTETLYLWIYRGVIQLPQAFRHLRTQRRKRKVARQSSSKRGVIANRKAIATRPAIVDKKLRYGDWEGDTIIGQQGSGAIATHVERKSLYLIAGKLPGKHAEPLTQVTVNKFRKIPKGLRKTLTFDNGKEFSDFKNIEKKLKLDVYFADPYSSWQRGCNENINGLLRQYFPKGSDFTNYSDKDIEIAVREINNRPRKSLNYRTPAEVMRAVRHRCTLN